MGSRVLGDSRGDGLTIIFSGIYLEAGPIDYVVVWSGSVYEFSPHSLIV